MNVPDCPIEASGTFPSGWTIEFGDVIADVQAGR